MAALVIAEAAAADPARIEAAGLTLASGGRPDRPGPLLLTLTLDRAVPYGVALAGSPPRLVVDLAGAVQPPDARGPVGAGAPMRWGPAQPGWARLIVDLPYPVRVVTAGVAKGGDAGSGAGTADAGDTAAPDTAAPDNAAQPGGAVSPAALTIRMEPVSDADFSPGPPPPAAAGLAPGRVTAPVALSDAAALPASAAPSAAAPAAKAGASAPAARGAPAGPSAPRPVRVVIDPGHGGGDPGAQVGAISEAAVMLGFAADLANALRAAGADPVLTRAEDRFIPLEQRTTIARANGADLFLSLHADALPAGQAAGATVYVWNPGSNDRAAQQLALRHDRTDMLAGMDLADTDETVTRALIDLARTDTQPRSESFAAHLTAQLNQAGVAMHRVPVRGAAFSVLKSPDIPSVLLELGFLTDPTDRANLFDPQWRTAVAAAIAHAVTDWAADDRAQSALRRR